MKSTCMIAAAAALFALNACKEKGAEPADDSAAKAEASAKSGTSAPAPAKPETPAKATTMTPEEYETAVLDGMEESSKLIEKFAAGGSKEDFIAGMRALAAKSAKQIGTVPPDQQAKYTAVMQSPKVTEAAQKIGTHMQEIMTKHPDFAQKMADPEVMKAMQSLGGQ